MTPPLSGRPGELAFAKQTGEGVPNAAPAYGVPFAGGGIDFDQKETAIETTDPSSVDVVAEYKESQAVAGSASIIAVPKALGLLMLGAMGVDTTSGVGPYTHTDTFATDDSGLSWLTVYQRVGSRYNKFTDCKVDELSFNFIPGKPIVVDLSVKGKVGEELAAPYTAPTVVEGLGSVFSYQGANMKYDEDATPAATQHRNITGAKVSVKRNIVVQQTDALTPQYIFSTIYSVEVEMDVWYEDAKLVRSAYFGSAAGLTSSATMVYGAIDFLSTIDANRTFEIKIPKVRFKVPLPPATQDGSPVTLKVTGKAIKPAAGSLADIILKNDVASY